MSKRGTKSRTALRAIEITSAKQEPYCCMLYPCPGLPGMLERFLHLSTHVPTTLTIYVWLIVLFPVCLILPLPALYMLSEFYQIRWEFRFLRPLFGVTPLPALWSILSCLLYIGYPKKDTQDISLAPLPEEEHAVN